MTSGFHQKQKVKGSSKGINLSKRKKEKKKGKVPLLKA